MFSHRYIRQKTLGQGAFGVVYAAFDQQTSKTVAVKCVKDKESIDTFQAEMHLLKRLHHHAIVPYLDSFVDRSGSLHIVMEYAENGSLHDVVHKYGELNETVAAIYIAQILSGLAYLHEQNVIHRDIKAANVLIQGGVAKLADFGLALDLKAYGHTLRECAGSPYWMAPEVINGEPVNNKSDIWSVAATTFELLKGKPPLFELAPVQAMFQIAGKRVMPIPEDVSETCYDFMEQCFDKNPRKRPDAAELLKHAWIANALQFVEPNEDMTDVRRLTLRVESLHMMNPRLSMGVSTRVVNREPQEVVQSLMDVNQYKTALKKVLVMLRSKEIDAQLVTSSCGMKTIVERVIAPEFRYQTLELIGMLCERSEKIATSLIELRIVQTLLTFEDDYSRIMALYILMTSKVGARLFFASNMMETVLPVLYSSPMLRMFSASFMMFLMVSDLPQRVIAAQFETVHVLNAAETAFKAVARFDDYNNLLNKKFRKLSSAPDVCSVMARGENDNGNSGLFDKTTFRECKVKQALPDSMFTKASQFVDDSIMVVHKLVDMTTSFGLELSDELKPLIYILSCSSDYQVLTSQQLCTLIKVFDVVCANSCHCDGLCIEPVVSALVTFAYSEDPAILSATVRCLSSVVMGRPKLCEFAADKGLGSALCHAISRQCDSPEFISALLCHIPKASAYAAFKMRDQFYLLIDLLNIQEWRSKVVRTISRWANFDGPFIDTELCCVDTAFDVMARLIKGASKLSVRESTLANTAIILRRCPTFAQELMTEQFVSDAVQAITNANNAKRALILDVLVATVLQQENPAAAAAEILPYVTAYSESDDCLTQKYALRIRVIARC